MLEWKMSYLVLTGGRLTDTQKKEATRVVTELKKHFRRNRYDREKVRESLRDFSASNPTKFGEAVAYVEEKVKEYLSRRMTLYPLHFAVVEGDVQRVQDLLERGADLFAKDDAGQTPLDVAIQGSREGIVDALVEAVVKDGQLENETFLESLRTAEDKVRVRLGSRHVLEVDPVGQCLELSEVDILEKAEDAQNVFNEFLDTDRPTRSLLDEFDNTPGEEGTEYVYLTGARSYVMSREEATRAFSFLGEEVLYQCTLAPLGTKWVTRKVWRHSFGGSAVLSKIFSFTVERAALFHGGPEVSRDLLSFGVLL